ncbi:hypothetical protein [Aliidiomarina sanyensis]|uniref:Type II/III secretion system secretin-like domain-containing protein n=1 Tax=Aliidiomarina sanyensis TaxID=1249555 RepID=A0A432WDL4_9GAMM|nr:hypothetical protein [Aliidiomarina sanyensis]RUO30502.1 hypothetical protein CWE11_09010 [Aliidiomarina sanyensis]
MIRFTVFGICILLLSGCLATSEFDAISASANERLNSARERAVVPSTRDVHIMHEQGYFVPPLNHPQNNTPGWFNLPVQFVFSDYPLRNALLDITSPIGVSVRLLDNIDPELPLTMQHSGTLAEAIEQIALTTGLSFTAEERLLTWRQYEMAEFDVAFLAGATNFFLGGDGSTMGAPSMPQGAQGLPLNTGLNDDSGQYLNFASDALSVWDDLARALQLLISTEGEIAINQSSTSVLVRDLPQYVQQVREYLMQQNERLTRQVAVDVQVIDVTFNDSTQSAVDWDLIYQATEASGAFNLGSHVGQLSRDGLSLGYERLQGPMAGSQLLLRALSQQGVVEISNHPRLVTLNNQISKIILEDNVTYLASAGSSSTANVGSNDLLIPGVVRTGFELYLLPKVANDQVLLQLSTSLSDLKNINEVSSGDTTIQTPQTSRKKFFMKAIVQNQESLLISGLQNSRSHYQYDRSLMSRILGGSRSRSTQHTETLLILTPRILPSGRML